MILVAVLPGSALAASEKTCGQRVLEDWSDNYRVDGALYEERCYRDAVGLLGIDLRDYGTAEDDILRALSYARHGELDPGDGTGGEIAAPVTGADPSSVPLPLIVLGALGVLLLAAGAAGYLKRRFGDHGEPPAGI